MLCFCAECDFEVGNQVLCKIEGSSSLTDGVNAASLGSYMIFFFCEPR